MKREQWEPISQRRAPREAQDELQIEPPERPDASTPKDRNERKPEMGEGVVDATPKDDSGEDDSGKDYSGNI